VIFQDFPGPGIFKKKIQDYPRGVGTLISTAPSAATYYSVKDSAISKKWPHTGWHADLTI